MLYNMLYNTFPGLHECDMWNSNVYEYKYPGRHPHQPNKKHKHKYQVNDMVLDVVEGKVGLIRELLSWPDYFVGTSSESWVCHESHIEPLSDDIDEVSPTMNNLDDWEEEPEQYNPLSTGITDRITITDTGDITIRKSEDNLVNDGGESTTTSIKRIDNDVEELKCISDINQRNVADIEVKTHDIEQRVYDIEKRQKKISKLSKLSLLSRFL